jgi:hypothetical protein
LSTGREGQSLDTTENASKDGLLDGGMFLTRSPAVESAAQWALDEALAGCLGEIRWQSLAQGLLHTDDPWVVTRPPAQLSLASWPVDDALASLPGRDRRLAVEALRACAAAGLHDDERVLAATVSSFTQDLDVVLHVATRWARDGGDLRQVPMGRTFNGTFLYYVDRYFDPAQSHGGGWLTFRAGGASRFVHGAVPIAPSQVWLTFGWRPKERDPFSWGDGKAEVARLEMWNGPIRCSIQDRLYRQPILFRWIITETGWRQAEECLGATLKTVHELETFRAGLS